MLDHVQLLDETYLFGYHARNCAFREALNKHYSKVLLVHEEVTSYNM
ncbi:MAG: hypothetical protein IBX68_03235 [Dehalococcoidia bacterium]|nr:hypothetical protein [Dehalococcoidia bacterium]